VLEAGCGKGRHAQIISESGAALVFAVDIGDAVDVAYRNVGQLKNVHIIQSDIVNLPFAADFDFAFSVGVLHHMESPYSGLLDSWAAQGNGPCRSGFTDWKTTGGSYIWSIRSDKASLLIFRHYRSRFCLFLLVLPLFIVCKLFALPYSKRRSVIQVCLVLFYLDYLSYIGKFDLVEIHHIVFDHLVAPFQTTFLERKYGNGS